MNLNPRIILALLMVGLVTTAVVTISLASPPYGGGGEIRSALTEISVNDEVRYPLGQHIISDWDIDGDYEDHNWTSYYDGPLSADLEAPGGLTLDDISMPGVSITTSNPYNVQKVGDTYARLDDDEDPVIAKSIEKTYIIDGNETIYQYNLMYYGVDITYKTKADVYHKDPDISAAFRLFGDYGYWFEDGLVNIKAQQYFTIAPWYPEGVYNSTTDENNVTTTYEITEGWAGVLDAIIYSRDYGLVDEGADEDKNHIVEDIIEVGTSLNMYYHDSGSDLFSVEFSGDTALLNVPSSVDIETSCSLAAGAEYHVDALSKVDSCSPRNVKVQYKILVKVAATIEMSKLVVTGETQEETDEDNTFHKPLVPVISDFEESVSEFWADASEWANSPAGMFYIALVAIIAIVVLYFVLKTLIGSG